jgi:organic radical activating enzyme
MSQISAMSDEMVLQYIDQLTRGNETSLVVITGGEPFLQNFGSLVELLYSESYEIQVETNGSIFIPGFPYHLCSIVCSPKEAPVADGVEEVVTAWKFLVAEIEGGVDPEEASDLDELIVPSRGQVFLQPLDEKDPEKNAKNVARAVRLCQKYDVRLSLQLHKIIHVP